MTEYIANSKCESIHDQQETNESCDESTVKYVVVASSSEHGSSSIVCNCCFVFQLSILPTVPKSKSIFSSISRGVRKLIRKITPRKFIKCKRQ